MLKKSELKIAGRIGIHVFYSHPGHNTLIVGWGDEWKDFGYNEIPDRSERGEGLTEQIAGATTINVIE